MLSGGLVAGLTILLVVAALGVRGGGGEPGGVDLARPAPFDPVADHAGVELPGGQAGAAARGDLAEARAAGGSLPGQAVDRTGAPVVRDAFAEVAEPTCDDGTACFAWRASSAWWAGAPPPTLGGSLVLVAELAALAELHDEPGDVEVLEAGGLHLVTAHDLNTGAVLWRVRLTLHNDPGSAQAARPVVTDELVLLLAAGGQPVAVDLDDGREQWRLARDGFARITGATSTSDSVLVALATEARGGAPELALALDAVDGSERWAQPAARAVVVGSLVALVDEEGRVRGLDPATGEPQWETVHGRAPGLAVGIGPWVLLGDRVSLSLLDAADGEVLERWSGPAVPGVWRDGTQRAVLLLADDELHHLDDRGRRWVTALDEPCCLGAQVDAQSVVIGVEDGSLLRLARDDGRVVARREVRLPAGVDATHSFAAGHRFVARGGGEAIRVHDPIAGDLVARLPQETVPLVAGERIVLSTSGEVLVLLGEAASDLVPPGS